MSFLVGGLMEELMDQFDDVVTDFGLVHIVIFCSYFLLIEFLD